MNLVVGQLTSDLYWADHTLLLTGADKKPTSFTLGCLADNPFARKGRMYTL